jgi:hypothetical protein
METEFLLPHSQVPANCPYPEPARSSPCPHIPLPADTVNIVLPSTPGSPQLSISLRFPHQYPVHASPPRTSKLHALPISSSILSLPAPLYNIFPTLSHKRRDFRKKLLNIKCVFRFCLQILSENISLPNKNWTNQNSMQKEIKSRLKSGNACYHSVQNVLCSRLLSKNMKIKIYRTIILPVVFMGVKLGRRHWGRNVGWGCLRIGCWGEYLGLRGTR